MNKFHEPVLVREALAALKIAPGRRYIDATLGGGGHAVEIVKRGGIVLGIDVDQEAIDYVQERIRNQESGIRERLKLVRGNFKDIDEIARSHGFAKVNGILFDLGVSSHQLDTKERGFSFQREGPLDMRMDRNLSVSARDLINGLREKELYELFTKLGEERFARTISERIVRARGVKPIETTTQLVRVALVRPLARVFQALRIAVNDELNNLKEALPKAALLLASSGRLAVVSFHSLEDRIVKRSFLSFVQDGLGSVQTDKPIVPSVREVQRNPRARSAKLRAFERL